MTKFINYSTHPSTFKRDNGELVTIQPSGFEARREELHVSQPLIDGVPCFAMQFGEVYIQDKEGNRFPFPEPEADTFYIVSATTMMAMPDRTDVIAPYKVDRDTRIAEGFSVNSLEAIKLGALTDAKYFAGKAQEYWEQAEYAAWASGSGGYCHNRPSGVNDAEHELYIKYTGKPLYEK
jgi:hypothetical protein